MAVGEIQLAQLFALAAKPHEGAARTRKLSDLGPHLGNLITRFLGRLHIPEDPVKLCGNRLSSLLGGPLLLF